MMMTMMMKMMTTMAMMMMMMMVVVVVNDDNDDDDDDDDDDDGGGGGGGDDHDHDDVDDDDQNPQRGTIQLELLMSHGHAQAYGLLIAKIWRSLCRHRILSITVFITAKSEVFRILMLSWRPVPVNLGEQPIRNVSALLSR